MEKKTLEMIDEGIYRFLDGHADIMPRRLGKLIAMYYTDARIRKKYARFVGVEMGEGTFANLGLTVVSDNNHEICVHIGKNVSIAPYVTFLGGTGPNNGVEIKEIPYLREKRIYCKDIIVEDEVWIGANVTVFPGIRIGRCSVIGAGSVVMQDVESYSVYVGTPARKIRDLRE